MYRSRRRVSAFLYPAAWFAAGALVGALALMLIFGPPWSDSAGAPATTPQPDQQARAGDGEPTPILSGTQPPATQPAPTAVAAGSGGISAPSATTGAPTSTQSGPTRPVPTQPVATSAPTATLVKNGPTPTPTLLTREAIEATVRDVMERFQEAKAYSQRTGDVSQLDEVAAGEALARRIAMAQETAAAGCYYVMSLDAPMTYEFLEVRDDDYVRVRVTKTESRAYYCGDSLRDNITGDTYATVYIVERLEQGWRVTGWE